VTRERIYVWVESDEGMATKDDYRQPSCAKIANNNLVEISVHKLGIKFTQGNEKLTPNPEMSELRSRESAQDVSLPGARSLEQFAHAGNGSCKAISKWQLEDCYQVRSPLGVWTKSGLDLGFRSLKSQKRMS